ncbi:uncharacterized protein LOC128556871 [Mercenaria mercenaria]|uniref:uncharacterized protein LOC128556871 n=1 Tax=Mercenaria mercenaria TaxID=6596 RepID=UPI00234E553E|nr:uncharacterized protein LOC128556871 [Mercenaria mercenaria]
MSSSDVTSVCPICGSSEVVHLCSAYMEAKVVKERNKNSTGNYGDIKAGNENSVKKDIDKMETEKTDTDTDRLNESEPEIKVNGTEDEHPKFVVIYLGSSHLDRRFPPQTAMPWVMGEVRRSRDTFKEVQLQVHKSSLKAMAYEGLEQIESVFEHNLHTLSRFAKTHQDPRCFAYLRRQSLYSDFECHVFLANEESVGHLIKGQSHRGLNMENHFRSVTREPLDPECGNFTE